MIPRTILLPALFVACTPNEPVEIGATCGGLQKIEACAAGGKKAVCRAGRWQLEMSCPGPKGCYRITTGHGSTAVLCDGAT